MHKDRAADDVVHNDWPTLLQRQAARRCAVVDEFEIIEERRTESPLRDQHQTMPVRMEPLNLGLVGRGDRYRRIERSLQRRIATVMHLPCEPLLPKTKQSILRVIPHGNRSLSHRNSFLRRRGRSITHGLCEAFFNGTHWRSPPFDCTLQSTKAARPFKSYEVSPAPVSLIVSPRRTGGRPLRIFTTDEQSTVGRARTPGRCGDLSHGVCLLKASSSESLDPPCNVG